MKQLVLLALAATLLAVLGYRLTVTGSAEAPARDPASRAPTKTADVGAMAREPTAGTTPPPSRQPSPGAGDSGPAGPTAPEPGSPGEEAGAAPAGDFEPLPETLGVLRASAGTMTIDEYRLLASRPRDGETALLLYFYVKSCIGRARHPEQLEARLDYYDATLGSEDSVAALQAHEEVLGILQKHFARCGGLDDYDLVALAVSWLQQAAAAGHVGAQIAFYEELPALLATTEDRIFREPHYIDLHQGESQRLLERALASGHPDAFATMARALMDGVVYEPDATLALAHALVAQAAVDVLDPPTAVLTAELMASLGVAGLAEARVLARALCDRHPCPARP